MGGLFAGVFIGAATGIVETPAHQAHLGEAENGVGGCCRPSSKPQPPWFLQRSPWLPMRPRSCNPRPTSLSLLSSPEKTCISAQGKLLLLILLPERGTRVCHTDSHPDPLSLGQRTHVLARMLATGTQAAFSLGIRARGSPLQGLSSSCIPLHRNWSVTTSLTSDKLNMVLSWVTSLIQFVHCSRGGTE